MLFLLCFSFIVYLYYVFVYNREPHLPAPLQPQLEDVVVAAALDHLVAGVVPRVVDLVRHEQVLRVHRVAAQQDALETDRRLVTSQIS